MEDDQEDKDFKKKLAGNIYQVKVIFLIIQRAVRNGCKFRMRTEVEAAPKFDDALFYYKKPTDNLFHIRYLQAKHYNYENAEAIYEQFFENRLDLKMYFIAFREILQRFNEDSVDDFILCSNINLPSNNILTKRDNPNLTLNFLEETTPDPLFEAGSFCTYKRYKFTQSRFQNKEFRELCKGYSNLSLLATKLVDLIMKNERSGNNVISLKLDNFWFSCYHLAIMNLLEEQETVRFKNNFINTKEPKKNLTDEEKQLLEFREHFIKVIAAVTTMPGKQLKTIKLRNEFTQIYNPSAPQPSTHSIIPSNLAEEVIEVMLRNKPYDENNIQHASLLLRNVITYEMEYAFKDEFISGNITTAQQFHGIFFEKYEKALLNTFQTKELKISMDFENLLRNVTPASAHPAVIKENELAEKLALCFSYNKVMTVETIYEENVVFLKKILKVTEVQHIKLILPNNKSTNEIKTFYKKFLNYYATQKLKNVSIKLAEDFGKQRIVAIENDKIPLFAKEILEIFSSKKSFKETDKRLQYDKTRYGKHETLGMIEAFDGEAFDLANNKFRDILFDANPSIISDNVKTLKEELESQFRDNGYNFNDLHYFSIELINCQPEYTDLMERGSVENDINKFFRKFLFVTTPIESKLTEEIKLEIGDELNLLDAEIVTETLFANILKWVKEKEERFYDQKEATTLFTDIKQKMTNLMLIGCNSQYCLKLREYGDVFENTLKELEDFLNQNTYKILHLITNHSFLTAIKSEYTLRKLAYDKNDSFVFNPLTVLLRLQSILFEKHQTTVNHRLLIIVEKQTSSDLSRLINQIAQNICDNVLDKLVIITIEKSVLAEKLKKSVCANKNEDFHKSIYLQQPVNNYFTDLSKILQTNILNKAVCFNGKDVLFNQLIYDKPERNSVANKPYQFQGNEITLCRKIDKDNNEEFYNLLDTETLMKFINNEEIKIGKALEPFKLYDTDCYVERNINLIKINNNLFAQLIINHIFAIEQIGDANVRSFLKRNDVADESVLTFDTFVNIDSNGFFLAEDTSVLTNFHLLSKKSNIYVLLNGEKIEEDFEKTCKKYPNNFCHWLKLKENNLALFYSYVPAEQSGKAANSLKFCTEREKYCTVPVSETSLFKYLSKDKIVLIADSAGKGKSTTLTSWAQEMHKKSNENQGIKWNVRINLNMHSTTLMEIQRCNPLFESSLNLCFQNQDNYERIILQSLITNNHTCEDENLSFDNRIFKYFFERSRMLIMFDGFDEISPYYEKIVILLFSKLFFDLKNTIWITSRVKCQNMLEEKFDTFAYALNSFSLKQQEEFLKKFWKKRWQEKYGFLLVDETRLETYIAAFTNHCLKNEIGEVIGIPLQTKMLAEIFQENTEREKTQWEGCFDYITAKRYGNPNFENKIKSLFVLYESFVTKKIFTYYLEEKEIMDMSKVASLKLKHMISFCENKIHRIFGLLKMTNFNNDLRLPLEEEITEIKKWKEDFKYTIEDIGIIDKFTPDELPVFNHLTYAEYFAACYLHEKLVSFPAEVLKITEEILKNDVPVFLYVIKYLFEKEKSTFKNKHKTTILCYVGINGLLNCFRSFIELFDFPESSEENDLIVHARENGRLQIVAYTLFHVFKKDQNLNSLRSYICRYAEGYMSGGLIRDLANAYSHCVSFNICYMRSRNYSGLGNNYDIINLSWRNINHSSPIQKFLWFASCETILTTIGSMEINSFILVYEHEYEEYAKEQLTFFDDICARKDLAEDDKIIIFEKLYQQSVKTNEGGIIIYQILLAVLHNNCPNLFEVFFNKQDYEISNSLFLECFLIACKLNAVQTINVFITQATNTTNDIYQSLLYIAIKEHASCGIISKILDGTQTIIDKKYEYGKTALMILIESNDETCNIEILLNKNANLYLTDDDGNNSWNYAIQSIDADDVIKCFLKHWENSKFEAADLVNHPWIGIIWNFYNKTDFDINEVINGKTYLHQAIEKEEFALAHFLIVKGADINKKDINGDTALHYACRTDVVKILKLLLMNGATYSRCDACCIPNSKCGGIIKNVKWIFEQFSNTEVNCSEFTKHDCYLGCYANNEDGENLWHLLAKSDIYENANVLTEGKINKLNSKGNSPLQLAIQNEDLTMTKRLLEKGAYYNNIRDFPLEPKNDAEKLLYQLDNYFKAAQNGVVSYQENIDFGIYKIVKVKDKFGKTLLHYYAEKGNLKDAETFIDRDGNANERDAAGQTPLFYAVKSNEFEMVQLLLKKGAMFDYRTLGGFQNDCNDFFEKLEHIFNLMYNEMFDLFKDDVVSTNFGIDISIIFNVLDYKGKSLFQYAQEKNNFNMVKFLLKQGAVAEVSKYSSENKEIKRLFYFINNLFKIVKDGIYDTNSITKQMKSLEYSDIIPRVRLDNKWKNHSLERTLLVCSLNDNCRRSILAEQEEEEKANLSRKGKTKKMKQKKTCSNDDIDNSLIEWLLQNGAEHTATDKDGHTIYQIIPDFPADKALFAKYT